MINFKDKDLIAYKRLCIEQDYLIRQMESLKKKMDKKKEKLKQKGINNPAILMVYHYNDIP